MRGTLTVIATLALMGSAEAQTIFTWSTSLVVVHPGQLSRIGVTTSLDINCHFLGYQQIEVVSPPTNGKVYIKHLSAEYPTYPLNSERGRCDNAKKPAIEILYRANPGFIGTDNFKVEMIDVDHIPAIKPYTVEVQ